MDEQNVELVRRAYERFNTVGRVEPDEVDMQQLIPELWSRLASDFELHERPGLVDRRVYRGAEDSKKFWRKTWEIFAELRWEPQEVITTPDAVIVVAKVIATGRGSDVPVEMDESDVWWFRDDALIRSEAFASKEEALATVQAGGA